MFKSIIPLATAVILFAALVFSTTRDRAAFAALEANRDSLITQVAEEARIGASLLAPGDSLPTVRLSDANGANSDLRRLPRELRYIYFYRPDCPPCQLLDSAWLQAGSPKSDSIAFIAFHPDHDMVAQKIPNHYAWLHDASTRNKYVEHIPSLVVLGTDGRILTVAHGSLFAVAKVLDLFSVLPKAAVDSSYTAALRANSLSPSQPTPAGGSPHTT